MRMHLTGTAAGDARNVMLLQDSGLVERQEMKVIVRICSSLLLCLAVTACNKVVTKTSPPTPDSVKHRLYRDDYRVALGAVELPESCAWQAFPATDPSWSGNVLLVLEETRSDTVSVRPVMSYLTPQEAEQLSYLLRTAASEYAELGQRTDEAAPSVEVAAKEASAKGQGMGIVIEASIRNEIPSIRLQNVALSELLKTMLGAIGLAYEVRPGFIWISRPDVLTGEASVPPEVLAALPPTNDKSREQLVEEIKRKLEHPVGADLDAGPSVSYVLDFLSNHYDLKLVLDERVMLTATALYASPEAKHELYLDHFQILLGKVLRLPDICRWDVFHRAPWKENDHVLLGLSKPESESKASVLVNSYLTAREAADLSEQLEKAATECARSASSI